jgi:MATE family multidrug resistance protein
MIFTDRLMLSRLGTDAMNAAMSGGVSIQVAVFFFIGLTGYSTALAAQYFGAGQKRSSSATAFQAFLIALIAVPVVMIWLVPANYISVKLGITETQRVLQSQYMFILAAGTIFGLVRHVLSCYFAGIGKTKIVMAATLTALTVNVAVGYTLIYGKFGLPQLGIQGAAIGAVCGWTFAAAILMIVYFGRTNRSEFSSAKTLRFDRQIMGKLISYGYPAGIEMFFNFLAFSAIIQIFQSIGTHVATATTITFNWDLIAFIPLLGIEISVTSLVGRYMGARDPVTAEKTVYSAIKAGTVYSVITFILFATIPEVLVSVFRPDVATPVFENAKPLAASMIRIAALYVIAEAMMCSLVGALRGAGDTLFTMVWSVSAHWLFAITAFIMFKVFHLPPLTGWSTVIGIFLFFCLLLYLRFRSGHWTRIDVIGRINQEPEAEAE